MNEGLTNKDIKQFLELVVKANYQQLVVMRKQLLNEEVRRDAAEQEKINDLKNKKV